MSVRIAAVALVAALLVSFFVALDAAQARTKRLTPPIAAMPIPEGVVIHRDRSECPEVEGCARPERGEIWVGEDAHPNTVAHELGHVLFFQALFSDFVYNPATETWDGIPKPGTDEKREAVLHVLGYSPGTPWYGTDEYYASSNPDFLGQSPPPDELAADAYMVCSVDAGPKWYWTKPKRRGKKKAHATRFLRTDGATGYGYDPSSPREHRRVCDALRALA